MVRLLLALTLAACGGREDMITCHIDEDAGTVEACHIHYRVAPPPDAAETTKCVCEVTPWE